MDESKEKERYNHPSFGQIYFGRVSSTGAEFYGSELTQDHYVSMELKHSEVERTLTQDWYFARATPIVRLRMSSSQFAEMITSMNRGDGTCCTIEYLDGVKVADLPMQESRKEFVHRKFGDRMTEFSNTLKKDQLEALKIIGKKTLSKEDQQRLKFLITGLTTEVSDNIPFFGKCFQETMDEVVQEAKLEVENAIQHKINVLGLNELHNQNKLLE